MAAWEARFARKVSLGGDGIGVGQGGEAYPHMYGDQSAYRGSAIAPGARKHTRYISVRSPVNVLITTVNGRQLGILADGSMVNEIPEADFDAVPMGDGTTQWLIGLPDDHYRVHLTGTESGEFHLLVGNDQGVLVYYPPQPIAAGEQATFLVSPGTVVRDLTVPSGATVMPIMVTEKNIADLDLGEPLPVVDPPEAEARSDSAADLLSLAVGTVVFLCPCVGLLLAGFALVVLSRRRKK
jgi:hypothetical protein